MTEIDNDPMNNNKNNKLTLCIFATKKKTFNK